MILTSARLLIGLFFSILFLQSGLDKVFNFQSNKGYIESVFENTFLKKNSLLLFIGITVLEVAAGLLCAGGTLYSLFTGDKMILLLGLQTAAVSLLGLFFGQRIAKDYAGAAGLVPYFLLAVFGIFLFQ
ncbi:hypothetical protein D9M68_882760 [compost metagenome]